MIPAYNDLDTDCIQIQYDFDRSVFCFAEKATQCVIDLSTKVREPLLFDTLLPRVLYVAQSISCCVLLIFKIPLALMFGLVATISSDISHRMAFLYAVSSVGVYAASIPMGLVLACQSTSLIAEIKEARRPAFSRLLAQELRQRLELIARLFQEL